MRFPTTSPAVVAVFSFKKNHGDLEERRYQNVPSTMLYDHNIAIRIFVVQMEYPCFPLIILYRFIVRHRTDKDQTDLGN